MAKRRKPLDPDPETIHREMLEYLDRNPPPRTRAEADPPSVHQPDPPSPPRLMLRKLRLVTALHRLETFVRQHRFMGTPEVLVVVGRGHGSGERGPVISPAVQEWCDAHPELIRSWSFASPDQGGAGALVLRLKPAGE
jgi:dsDNA-specific endonuclease/ATPase MutS2